MNSLFSKTTIQKMQTQKYHTKPAQSSYDWCKSHVGLRVAETMQEDMMVRCHQRLRK